MLALVGQVAFAQQTVITGKVTDANTGDPVPFANVVFAGTTNGTTTDFDGRYTIQTNQTVDSVRASYVGYITKTKAIESGVSQIIDFQLEEDVISLQEVVFVAGENPAFEIMRNVIANKDNNNKRSLEAYEYETYTKIEIDVDNITDKFRNKKIMRKITSVLDSVDRIAGEDGKPILPIFISESLSEYHFRNNPKLQHEKILKTKITGVGVEDGTLVAQFIGSSFQEYNFYQNWLNIVGKEFVSPVADGWKLYYEYDLTDSAFVGDHFCYQLDFFPKSDQDLAFKGTMWITKDGYAIKQMDATVAPNANLNYVEKIKIQQELEPTDAGPWIPSKNRVLLDIGEVTDNMAGVLAKFYTSNKNIKVNQPQDQKFYARPIEVAEDFKVGSNDDYWNSHRHEPLSDTEISVYNMIDTLKNIPVVKTYTEILKIAINGYFKAGPIDVGPYLSVYANNTIEGNRFQLGGRTNIDFSNRWVFGGYLAYGTEDDRYKYQGRVRYIASRDIWTTIDLQYTNDIDQVGLAAEDLLGNSIFLTATRFGELVRPYYYEQGKVSFQRQLFKGYRQTISGRYRSFKPLFNFAYYENPETTDGPISDDIETAEVTVEARYAKDEVFVQNDNDRISLGTLKWPIFTLRYTRGIAGILGSEFNYNKVSLNIQKDVKMGFFGTSSVSLTGEYIFETLPYPLLKAHIGNESMFYTTAAYNLMNFSEFVSDRYVELRYLHRFQGFILNRIPLMKKLKWRLIASADVVYGRLSEENQNILSPVDLNGNPTDPIGFFDDRPYVEVGYGVENVFKVLWIEFFHRLTFLDKPDVNNFGVKLSFQFIL
nr:DUF5686 and carboxypeptidase-like regulatory domain-containing protein [Fulvivirga aurantia]